MAALEPILDSNRCPSVYPFVCVLSFFFFLSFSSFLGSIYRRLISVGGQTGVVFSNGSTSDTNQPNNACCSSLPNVICTFCTDRHFGWLGVVLLFLHTSTPGSCCNRRCSIVRYFLSICMIEKRYNSKDYRDCSSVVY